MPQRSAPTARQRRLGYELRRLRERAGLSATEAGQLLGVQQSRISNTEAGRIPISPERVRTFAHAYQCPDADLIEALAGMPSGRARNWWDEYRETLPAGLLDLAEMEHHATRIRTAQVTHIPGVLQTVDYARLVFRQSIPALPPPEVEFRVSHRVKRQGILYRDVPTPFTAVIHEAALRMKFGGVAVTREQLEHVADMSERPEIAVRVIPFEAGIFPGSGQTIVLAEGPVPQLDTVQLDVAHGFELVHAEVALEKYRMVLDRMEAMALDPEPSTEFIRSLASAL
ncbi:MULTISPECIES: helix-turn-helix domain-containing protein [unclassified Streptomyces]|uniref:helix-turn-helix domain-containing protein n=1 Tax=unclassified Streptomyces TaxID=2593676 RepID=UPI0022B64672|nr:MULTISPECIES: helix-turn-helix transcriptional regulator [unclassified Streptomyces]MCZ7416781.1 helix-turn-helix transcriptional regulator [Streptomyces sp. WMMC897]MCZ7433409.1 helix-turn-helix transcriptional regulator [Streptomyces sp. WMMC1477]